MRALTRAIEDWLNTMPEPQRTTVGTLVALAALPTAIIWLPLALIYDVFAERKER